MPKSQFPPGRDSIPPSKTYGVSLHEETARFVDDPAALADALGGSGIKHVFSNPIVLVAAVSACLGGLLFGFDQGLLSIVLTMEQFKSIFPEIDTTVSSSAGINKGIMTALLELGALIGAVMAGFIADKYSRKGSIAFGSVWFVIGSILQTTSFSFAQLVVGRFVGGIGIGVLSSTAPMYISEIAPPNVRGAFLVLEGASIVFGIVVMYYVTYGTRFIPSDWSFRLPFLLQISPYLILGIVLWTLPFSPRWLAQKGRDEECLHSLVRLRRLPASDPRVQAEWVTIRAEAIRSREVLLLAHPSLQGVDFISELKLECAAWIDMFRPGIWRRTMIGVMLMFFQQFAGINALIYYAPTLFDQLGLDYQLQLTLSGVLNIAQLIAVVIAFLFLDHVGRRPPLLFGAVGMTVSHFIVAAMIGKYSTDWDDHPVPAWIGVAFIFVFIFTYGLGWSPVPWAMPAELHSTSRRAKGVAITTCSNWLNNFIIGLITPPMIQGTGYGTFIFFGAFALLAGIFTFFFVPETAGKTLEEMDALFQSHGAEDEIAARADILRLLMHDHSPSKSRMGAIDRYQKVPRQEWIENDPKK